MVDDAGDSGLGPPPGCGRTLGRGVAVTLGVLLLWWGAYSLERWWTKPENFLVGARVEVTVDGAPVVFEEYVTCKFVKVFSGGIGEGDAYDYLPWPQAIGKRLSDDLAVAATVPWDICRRMGQHLPWIQERYRIRPHDRPDPALPDDWLPVLVLMEGAWPPHTLEIPLTWEAAHDPANRVTFGRMALLPTPPEGSGVEAQMEFEAFASNDAKRVRREGGLPKQWVKTYYAAIALPAYPPWAEWMTDVAPGTGTPFTVPKEHLERLVPHFPGIEQISEGLLGPHKYAGFGIDRYIARGGLMRRLRDGRYEPIKRFAPVVLATRLEDVALEITDRRELLRMYRTDLFPSPKKPRFQPDLRISGTLLDRLDRSPTIAIPAEQQIYWLPTTFDTFAFLPDARRTDR